jgi:hypothetical protein
MPKNVLRLAPQCATCEYRFKSRVREFHALSAMVGNSIPKFAALADIHQTRPAPQKVHPWQLSAAGGPWQSTYLIERQYAEAIEATIAYVSFPSGALPFLPKSARRKPITDCAHFPRSPLLRRAARERRVSAHSLRYAMFLSL